MSLNQKRFVFLLPLLSNWQAAPQAGFYFPSKELVLYPEFTIDDATPFVPFATNYVTEWFDHPFADASCVANHSDNPAACWDMSTLYVSLIRNWTADGRLCMIDA